MKGKDIRVWITTFTITRENGEKKTFSGPYIFAFDYNEAKQEAEMLSDAAVSINSKIVIDIVGELNDQTNQPILH